MLSADRYLRTSVFVVRYQGGYVLVHPGSSVIVITDALGAGVARRLIRGATERHVRAWAESRFPGAGERVALLVNRLATIGAITTEAPRRDLRWYLREWQSGLAGYALTLMSMLAVLLPVHALRLLVDLLPITPLLARTVGQIWPYVDANLRASGYTDKGEPWRRGVARACAASNARTFLLMYLTLNLPPRKLHALDRALFDMETFAILNRRLDECGGAVLAGLHTDLCFAVMPLLADVGWRPIVIADVPSLGTNIGSDVPAGLDTLGQYARIVNSRTRMAGKKLLDELRAGNVAVLAFDSPPLNVVGAANAGTAASLPTVGLLGRRVYRVDGAAWLAVRSGKPIVFAATYRLGRRTALYVQPPLYPHPNLPYRAQVEELSERLYRTAEAFLRQHPEAWMAWCYVHNFVVPDDLSAQHGESMDEGVFAAT